jgi:hypothetical protein
LHYFEINGSKLAESFSNKCESIRWDTVFEESLQQLCRLLVFVDEVRKRPHPICIAF